MFVALSYWGDNLSPESLIYSALKIVTSGKLDHGQLLSDSADHQHVMTKGLYPFLYGNQPPFTI